MYIFTSTGAAHSAHPHLRLESADEQAGGVRVPGPGEYWPLIGPLSTILTSDWSRLGAPGPGC